MQMIAVDAEALRELHRKLDRIEARLDGQHEEWLPVKLAAQKLEVSEATVRRWIKTGQIEAKGAGKARRVRVI